MPVSKREKPVNETEEETIARLREAGRLLYEAMKPYGPVEHRTTEGAKQSDE